jgi:hypothetical protein
MVAKSLATVILFSALYGLFSGAFITVINHALRCPDLGYSPDWDEDWEHYLISVSVFS